MFTDHKKLNLILFVIVFAILAYFASGLKLYLDDFYYAYPSFFGNYQEHMSWYFKNYGFFRPVSLFYYYLVLIIYQAFPYLSHQIPLIIYLVGIYYFYKLQKLHGLPDRLTLLSSILLLSYPWAVEGWAWFSANPSVIVTFLLALQIYLAEKYSLNLQNYLFIFLLQILIVFIYDSPLLFPLSLSYLLFSGFRTNSGFKNNRLPKFILISAIFFIPTIINLILRTYFQPGMEIRFKMISPADAVYHWGNILFFFKSLFTPKAFQDFWVGGSGHGYNLIFSNFFTAILFLSLIFIIFQIFFNLKSEDRIVPDSARLIKFWLFSFILSLIPLSWQVTYSPFRTFILPAICLTQAGVYWFSINRLKVRLSPYLVFAVKMLFVYMTLNFFALQVHMVDSYIRQYEMDKKITFETQYFLKNLNVDAFDYTHIYFSNVPNNNLWSFVYGDYVLSAYYHYWTAEYFYRIHAGSWKNIGVELEENRKFLSKYDKDLFLAKKPLVMLKYNGYKKCLYDECYNFQKLMN